MIGAMFWVSASAKDLRPHQFHDRVAVVGATSFPRLAAIAYGGGAVKLERPAVQAHLAKFDLVVLGTWPGWNAIRSAAPLRDAVRSIKAFNPGVLVGHYTVLNEAYLDRKGPFRERTAKLDKENWWLRDANGSMVQWSKDFGAWDINITGWAQADSNGMRYPEWAADYFYKSYFQPVPEFDIWFFDNVTDRQFVAQADWKRAGANQGNKELEISQAFRKGQADEWRAARKRAPEILLVGNTTTDLSFPEYKDQLQGAFMECAIGASWSLEKQVGWQRMMERYRTLASNLQEPKLVIFGVCAPDPEDYRLFRYAFATSLMANGYFALNPKMAYSSWPWYDEFDVDLGRALDDPPLKSLPAGHYQRRFEKGLVMVNPTDGTVEVDVPPGYRHIGGRQDPQVNNGKIVTHLQLPAKDGIVLIAR